MHRVLFVILLFCTSSCSFGRVGESPHIRISQDGHKSLTVSGYTNSCPPGMYLKGLDGCVPDSPSCREGQILTGFPGSQFCIEEEGYYRDLRRECEIKYGSPGSQDDFSRNTCNESVDFMESNEYRLTALINTGSVDCPIGMKVSGFTRLGGLTWCEPSDNPYDILGTTCADDPCCLSSVETMREGSFHEIEGTSCPRGLTPNTHRCLNSKTWCEPIQ